MRLSLKHLVCLGLTAALVSCAGGKNKPKPVPPEIQDRMVERFLMRADVNGDGQATCDDVTTARTRLFRKINENKDQFLVFTEYRMAKFDDREYMFYEFGDVDSDENNFITLSEFLAVPKSNFNSIDKNGNCIAERAEIVEKMRDEFHPGKKRGGKGENEGRRRGGIEVPPID